MYRYQEPAFSGLATMENSRKPLQISCSGERSSPSYFHQHNHRDYNELMRSKGIRRYDVGVDANEFYPVSIDEIIDFMEGSNESNKL